MNSQLVSDLDAPSAQPRRCTLCGSEKDCRCEAYRTEVLDYAQQLATAGITAARAHELHRARTVLSDSVQLSGGAPIELRILGLCSLAIGDVGGAVRAWVAAEQLQPDLKTSEWLASLESGRVRLALTEFNQARTDVQAGRIREAEERVNHVLTEIPEFLPAIRLKGLLFAARGQMLEAILAWQNGLRVCADDPELIRLLAVYAGDTLVPSRLVSQRKRGIPRAVWGTGWAVSLAAAIVLTQWWTSPDRDQTVAKQTGSHALTTVVATPPDGPKIPFVPKTTLSVEAYRLGREASARGAWSETVQHLAPAVESGVMAYYVDDALYLLARACARLNDPNCAKQAASRILAIRPPSLFANSITRHLAEHGAEP